MGYYWCGMESMGLFLDSTFLVVSFGCKVESAIRESICCKRQLVLGRLFYAEFP